MRPLLRHLPLRPPRLHKPGKHAFSALTSHANSFTATSVPSTAAAATSAAGEAQPVFPPVIFSGIQPTGIPHLGNYLGALKPWAELCKNAPKDTKLIFALVDWHAITKRQEKEQLRQWRRESFAVLLACGVDLERAVLFEQSMVPEHVELMWALSTVTSVGALNRMTQWKSKLGQEAPDTDFAEAVQNVGRLGLFSYPVLQAADVLVHRATAVPVGEDQAQHLELTRTIAGSFNHIYGKVFPLPETLLSPAKRVMCLQNPKNKMSKSTPDKRSRIMLNDPPERIREVVMKAITDSTGKPLEYDPVERPGISNLLRIGSILTETPMEKIADMLNSAKSPYKELKEYVAKAAQEELAPIREEYEAIVKKGDGWLDEVAMEGAKKASESARETMLAVRDVMGLPGIGRYRY